MKAEFRKYYKAIVNYSPNSKKDNNTKIEPLPNGTEVICCCFDVSGTSPYWPNQSVLDANISGYEQERTGQSFPESDLIIIEESNITEWTKFRYIV